MAAKKKDEMPVFCNASLLSSIMHTLMDRPSTLKILNYISDIKNKYKVLICYIQDDRQF